MPRNSWSSLQEVASPGAPAAGDTTARLPESLVALQRERLELEARMKRLASGGTEPAGDADARFPVTPLALRRQADAAWASHRDAQAGRPSWREAPGEEVRPVERSGDAPRLLLRTGQRLLGEPASRSGLREQPRSWFEKGALGCAARGVMSVREPGELRGRESLGAYEARRERLLSVVEGGCGDLDQRAERARKLALERHQWQRREQQADDRRLVRARQQRQAQEDEP